MKAHVTTVTAPPKKRARKKRPLVHAGFPGSRRIAARVSIDQLKKIMRPVFEKKRIAKALLFGSYARGTEDDKSDIDIFIVKKTDTRFLDRFEEFTELYRLLNGYALDLIVYSPEELERNRHRPFIRTVFSEGVLLYER